MSRLFAGLCLLLVISLLIWAFFQPARNNPFEALDALTWLRARNQDIGYSRMPFVPAGTNGRFVPRNLWNEAKPCCGIDSNDEHILPLFDETGAVHTVAEMHHSPKGQLFALTVEGAVFALESQDPWRWRQIALPILYEESNGKRTDYGYTTSVKSRSAAVNSLAISRDGRWIAFAGDDAILRSSEANAEAQEWQAAGHSDAILNIDYNIDGSEVVTASRDRTARIWSTNRRRDTAADIWDTFSAPTTRVLKGHASAVISARFSPDSRQVLTASSDNTAKVWKAQTGQLLHTLTGHTAPLNAADFSKDGKRIYTASDDGFIIEWDSQTFRKSANLAIGMPVKGVSVSADGSQIAVITNQDLALWTSIKGIYQILWKVPFKTPFRVTFSPGGERLLCVGPDDLQVLALDQTLLFDFHPPSANQRFRSATYSPRGRELLVGTSNGAVLHVKTEWGPQPQITAIASSSTGIVWVGGTDGYLAFSADGQDWRRLDLDPNLGSSSGASVVYNSQILAIAATRGLDAYVLMEHNKLRTINDSTRLPLANGVNGTVQNDPAQSAPVGGRTRGWPSTSIGEPNSPVLTSLFFRDANEGWAAGVNGRILHTVDAARSWKEQFRSPGLLIRDIRIEKSDIGWAVGLNGTGGTVALESGRATGESAAWKPLPFHLPRWFYLVGLPLLVLAMVFNILVWRRRPDEEERQSIEEVVISDDPLRWTDPESRTLRPLARSLSRFLRNIKTRPPLTLAITGRWGSGKSSLMQLLMSDVQYYDGRAVWFNAWHHRDEDDLLAALFAAIRNKAPPAWWGWPGVVFRLRLFAARTRTQALHLGYIALFLSIAATTLYLGVNGLSGRIDEIFATMRTLYPALDIEGWELLTKVALTGSGAALFAAFMAWFTGKFAALPANPAKLAAAVAKRATLSDFSAKLAFRSQFGEQFGEVCDALLTSSSPGLLIFIDDLDRCQPDDVLKILEAVNYLTSAGPCTIVLGMDRSQVEHCVGLGFAKLVEGLPDGGLEVAPGETIQFVKQRVFARHYLEKLINIEVLVPSLGDLNTEAMLTHDGGRSAADIIDGPLWLREWKHNFRGLLQIARVGLIAFVFGILAIWFVDKFSSTSSTITAKTESDNPVSSAPSSFAVSPRPAPAPSQTSFTATPFMPAAYVTAPPPITLELPPSTQWVWWAPAVFFLGLAVLFGLSTASREARKIVRDSPEFTKALLCVKPLFTFANATPRIIKRYQNRMRYLAARLRPDFHEPDKIDALLHLLTSRFRGGLVPHEWFEAPPTPTIRDSSLILLGAVELFSTDALASPATLAAELPKSDPADARSIERAAAWRLVIASFAQKGLALPTLAEIANFTAMVASKL